MKLSFWRRVSAIFLAVLLAVSTPVLAVSETMDGVFETVAPTEIPAETVAPEEPVVTENETETAAPAEEPVVNEETTAPSADPSVTYTLTFNGNGAKLTTAYAGSYTSKTHYAAGTEVSLSKALDGKKFSKDLSADYSTNYRQLGWNTAKDGSGTHYDMGATFVMPEGNTTLYAEWEGYEWIHWEAVLAEGGESITIHEGVTGKTEKVGESFKLFTGNTGNQYGMVPAAYYTPVVAAAKVGYLFTGWYDGETLVTESETLTMQDFRNLRKLTMAESGAKLEARFEKLPTITYTDGVGGKAFADQVYYVKAGEATPAFDGTPARANCEFTGWTPEVAETVTGDATYTATWTVSEPAVPSYSNSAKDLFVFHCTTDSEAHADQVRSFNGTYNKDMAFDAERGVYTATFTITNVQTMLSTGVGAPEKVWGVKHYHTDENGKDVRTATIKLVWNPDEGLWMPDGEQVVNVWHPTAPAAPTISALPSSTKTSTAIRVHNSEVPFSTSNTRDSVDSNVHYFRDLKEGTYEFSEVTKDENGDFWCTLKITDLAPYVANFNSRKGNPTPAFRIDTEKVTANFQWTLKYTGSKTSYAIDGSGWSLQSSSWDKGETSRTGKLLYVAQFYTVTYTDGANGEAFADQATNVKPGEATPAFDGTPTRANYDFAGWEPEVAETVTEDVTYTAKWTVAEPAVPSYSNSAKDLFVFHCTTDSEAHADQVRSFNGTYNKDMAFDAERGVYTATFTITNVQTMLSTGVGAPEKVWGVKHYHTDENGKDVRTATIKLVWNPDEGLWEPDGEQVVNVWHATAPAAPKLSMLTPKSMQTSTALRVQNSEVPFSASNTRDSVDSNVHYFKYLKDGTYEISEVTKDDNGDFWCTLTITDFAPYVAEFNTRNSNPTPAYAIDTEKTTANFQWTLKYSGSKTNYALDGSGWTVDSSSWATGETSRTGKILYVSQYYTVTYTDGANGEAFADQVKSVRKGDATPAFDGTPTRTNYDFAGWTPEVAETVTEDVTYTATWTPSTKNKPKKLTSTQVDQMNIRAYAEGTEHFSALNEMSSCAPSIHAKGVSYTIGDVVGNDVDGYTTTVTFHFISGDKFEAAARGVFNTERGLGYYDDWEKWTGNWSYSFNDERPADQTLNLIYVTSTNKVTGKVTGSWKILKDGEPYGNNITAAVANIIKVNLKLERTVTYTDGANGEAFADQVYTVRNGAATPAFSGTPTRTNYDFVGWEPEVAENVFEDVTYTAKWTPSTKNKPTKKITAKDVESMGITVFAEGTEVLNPNDEMYSCMPTNRAKGVSYTIGDIVGNDVDGYTTTVTFHFATGDQLETAARNVFNTYKNFNAISGWSNWIGNWTYNFTEERPADQVLTLTYVTYVNSKTGKVSGYWRILKDGQPYANNITTAVGNIIQLNVKLERTVTYTDGVEGTVFADQVTTVRNGVDTPAFTGTLTREGYVFDGWTPEVAEKVYADVTYTATWAEDKNGNGVADYKDPHYTVTYTDGVEDEVVFEDEVYADQLVDMPTPAFTGDTARKGYVFKGWAPEVSETVTADVTYVAVWGVDKNGNGIDDADETHYTVTYTDGVEKKEVFADQVYEGLVAGEATPAFNGTPTRKGYKFGGWEPKVAETVTDNAVYTAKWIKIEDTDEVPKTGDFATAPAALLASSLTFLGLGVVLSIESRKAKKNNH